jgi:hypothetical protein
MASLRLVIVTAFAVATVAGCATPDLPTEPEPMPTSHRPSKSAAGAPTAGAASSGAPAAPSNGDTAAPAPSAGNGETGGAGAVQHWKGEIAATVPVDFGGAGYCDYRITLEQVVVDVTVTENGDVLAASVTAIAAEALRSSCPSAAIPTNVHAYELVGHASSTLLPSGAVRLVLAPMAANQPQASLVLEGDFRSASTAVSLAWSRTDVGPPVDWKINATVTGSRQ